MDSPSYFVRHKALKDLVSGTPDRTRRDVAARIKKLLRDSNLQNQELAIDSLGDWGTSEDVPALRELAADRFSTFVRPQVARALGKIEGKEVVDGLVDLLLMGPAEQVHAILALRSHGMLAEEKLHQRAQGADSHELFRIYAALGEIGTEKSCMFLEEAAKNQNPVVGAAAKQALEKLVRQVPKP